AYAKEMHQKFSKGKFPESRRNEPLEAQNILGYDIPLTVVLPKPEQPEQTQPQPQPEP
ncbi:hypothetical protein A2U01_0073549, partial [Trifolium medium]|nr:hypothetical protein [Trifolium medium]